MKAALIGLALVGVITLAGYGLRDDISGVLGIKRDPIRARITLRNHCNVTDRAFVVRDLKTGHYASFRGGVATLRTVERNRLRIEISPRFADVNLTAQSVPARERMTMTAKCTSKNWDKGYFAKD